MGLCCDAGFDIGETVQCFDSFQTVMEGNQWGRREKEKRSGVGVGGCGREGIWAAQCHTREDCKENEKGVGEDRLISVFVKLETGGRLAA